VGAVAALDNVFDIGFQTRFTGGILQRVLEMGTDFNNVITPNTYTLKNTGSANYVNCPIPTGTGILKVESAGEAGQVRQVVTTCDKTNPLIYERYYYQSSWGDWVLITNDTGWLNITLSSGVKVDTEHGYLKGRYKNGILYIKGGVTGVTANWQMIASLPTQLMLLAQTHRFTGVYNLSNFCGLAIINQYQLYVSSNSTGSWNSSYNIAINEAICV
jgi:hypothetical protein